MIDILQLLRKSPGWALHSPLARTFGFAPELTDDQSMDNSSADVADERMASNWTKLDTSGATPAVRSGHAAAVVGNKMYVFGGYNDGVCHNDLHAFDLELHHWERIETPSCVQPDGRASHAWCASSDATKLYLFGGSGPQWGQTNMGKLLQYSIRERTWSIVEASGSCPPAGYGQTLCAIDGQLLLFGGTSGHIYVNDLYKLNEATLVWTKVETTGVPPSPRYKHQVATIGNRMYVIGGGLYDPPRGPIDTFYLNVDTLEWTQVDTKGDVPTSRIAHSISRTAEGSKILMFGGRDASGSRRSELSEFDLNTNEWTIHPQEQDAPDARDFHSAVMHDGQMFIFGGSNGAKRSNDVFRRTLKYYPASLLVLAMQAVRRHQKAIPKEEMGLLPVELRTGVMQINRHVRTQKVPTWG